MREIAELLQIIAAVSSTTSALDTVLAEFTEKTAQIFGADGCTVAEWDQENDTIVVLADYVSPEVDTPFKNVNHIGAAYPLAHYPASAQLLREHTPLIVYIDDAAADEAEKSLLEIFQWDGMLMVPMLYQEHAVGLLRLAIADKNRYQFTEEDRSLSQVLANQLAIAIKNFQLSEEVEEARIHTEAMRVIGRALASELDYQRIVRDVAEFAYRLVGAQFVYVVTPEGERLRLVATAGWDTKDEAIHSTGLSLSLLARGPLDKALQGERPVIIADIQSEANLGSWREEAERQGWRSMVAVPLLSHNRLVGVLAAHAHRPHFFTPNEMAILITLASQAAVAIQNARLFAELEAQRQELHEVSLRLVNAQEEERRRISRELHDELGQALTALKINLDVARRAVPEDAPTKLQHSVQEASSLAVHTLEAARSLSLELHPAMLDDLGLVSALRWEIDRYEQRTGLTIHFNADLGNIVLQPELEITVYRIITEALTNAARHARANSIEVNLKVENRQVELSVKDDGVGFDVESWLNSPGERRSLGLVSMRERAGLLGGQFEIFSNPGQGTKIQTQLPLNS